MVRVGEAPTQALPSDSALITAQDAPALQRLLWQLEELFLHLEEHSWHSSPLGSTANRDDSALSPLPYTSPHQLWSLPSQGYVVRQGNWAEPAQLPQPVQVLLHSSHHGIRRAHCRA